LFESAPLQWGEWPKSTFKWWPVVFNEYNLSLSGHYVTFLPPIVLNANIPHNDPSITYNGDGLNGDNGNNNDNNGDSDNDNKDKNNNNKLNLEDSSKSIAYDTIETLLNSRIYSLETQMTAVLVMSAVFLFSTVTLFILYTCFPSYLITETLVNSWQRAMRHLCKPMRCERVPGASAVRGRNCF
uniref:Transmembrane protein n=1 Tax=Anisakis simplex TaxID=6269 RepID=A0A0M3KI97_ANISI